MSFSYSERVVTLLCWGEASTPGSAINITLRVDSNECWGVGVWSGAE